MATFSIESNGRLEKTALYLNGETISGVKEVFLNIDEDGAFDAVIQYEGSDKNLYTKQIFTDYFDKIKITDPPFDEEEAEQLQMLTIESNGDIENTQVFYNQETLDGIVSLFIHIKAPNHISGFKSLFTAAKKVDTHVDFKAEITFRNEDDTMSTESVF
ncbi:MAG: hypothetical protein NT007_10330 [Candidatus Kapabacteria bacterium]|nr:hypothetical protein [Candidatus Kapabacteria bacterium]